MLVSLALFPADPIVSACRRLTWGAKLEAPVEYWMIQLCVLQRDDAMWRFQATHFCQCGDVVAWSRSVTRARTHRRHSFVTAALFFPPNLMQNLGGTVVVYQNASIFISSKRKILCLVVWVCESDLAYCCHQPDTCCPHLWRSRTSCGCGDLK